MLILFCCTNSPFKGSRIEKLSLLYLSCQVLGTLKHRIDHALSSVQNIQDLVLEAQEFLVAREDRLTNARRLALEAAAPGGDSEFTSLPQNMHHRNSLTNDPFSRGM